MNAQWEQSNARLQNLKKLVDNAGEAIRIMLVEDDDGDVVLAQRAFSKSTIHNELILCQSIALALTYFENDNPPDVVLLDLGFIVGSGQDLIRAIRAKPQFRRMPIIVTTTDDNPAVKAECLALGADTFIQKPIDFKFLDRLVQVLGQFHFLLIKKGDPEHDSTEDKSLEWELRKLIVFELRAFNDRVAALEDRAPIPPPAKKTP